MGGERLRPAGHAEVSGVCTAPEARGRGLAETIVRALVARMQARGELPFLHVQLGSASQATASSLYERIGFRERRRSVLRVMLHRPAAGGRGATREAGGENP
jgi:predicted GNAT family acetyltransferase